MNTGRASFAHSCTRQIVTRFALARTGIDFHRACRAASGVGRREAGAPTKRAESGVNSNDNCGVKGSPAVRHGVLSLPVLLSRREDGAGRKKGKAHALRESECSPG